MERKSSSLAGPLWVIGIGLCIVGIGLFFMASVLSHKRKAEELERVTIASARLKVTSETDTTTVTTTTFPAPPVRPSLAVRSNSIVPAPPAAIPIKPSTESSPITPPITAPKKADFFGLAGSQTGAGRSGSPEIFGRVILKGTPPTEKELPLDPACGKLHPTRKPTTRFYSAAPDGGLADVFVVLSGPTIRTGGEQLPPVVIDQIGCEYVPYVTAALINQTVLVKNSDPILHNVHPTPAVAGNRESNRAQLPNAAPLQFAFAQPELFLRFKCDVHPWMFSYVSIVNHRYFSVTDATGGFRLNATPPPGRYTIDAYHRKAGKLSYEIEVRAAENLKVDFEMQVP